MSLVPIVTSESSVLPHMCSIWCSAIVDAIVLGVLVLLTLVYGLVLTRGLASTCDTLLDINKEENE